MTPAPERLSPRKARRIALAAQGFADRLPPGEPTARHLVRVLDRVGLVQIDSVNVLSRSHYLPFFSRLGPYDRAILDRLTHGRRRRLFEYWGHEASFIPLEQQPNLRWRMARAARGEGIYGGLAGFAADRPDYVSAVLKEIRERGPLTASELSEGGKASGAWWGWSDGKRALEFLFWAGEITVADRRNFERVYDVPERVLPPQIVGAPTPDDAAAQRALLATAIRAMGVATFSDLRDYFRLPLADAKARVREMVEEGSLVPAEVQGWKQEAYLDPAARAPRLKDRAALLSPFDSLVWERPRAERLFGFRYRLEIYTPSEKRLYGYYVLPFLLDERIVARICLKADRQAGVLRGNATHLEEGADAGETAERLAGELLRMADWLGLGEVVVEPSGDLAEPLRQSLARP
ncbi:winged helix-turn-helix domain-containing protein [Lutibaculum baratangense]|nr:winged helix-turn-helix domain-containing protein [Lutibaculum baratangense]